MKKSILLIAAGIVTLASCTKKGGHGGHTPGCHTLQGPELTGRWYLVQSTTATGEVSTPDTKGYTQLYIFNPDLSFLIVAGSDTTVASYTRQAADDAGQALGMQEIVTLPGDGKSYYCHYTTDSMIMRATTPGGSGNRFARVKPVMW